MCSFLCVCVCVFFLLQIRTSVWSIMAAVLIIAWISRWVSFAAAPTTWSWSGTASVRVSGSLMEQLQKQPRPKIYLFCIHKSGLYHSSYIHIIIQCKLWLFTLVNYLFDSLEVDVCLERDTCDQLCFHNNGSLTCECQEGYRTNATTGECKAEGEQQIISQQFQMCAISGAARFLNSFY